MSEQIKKMYRVTLDHDDGYSHLTFNEYNVVRQTEKSVWIDKSHWSKKTLKRVSIQDGGRQPFAFTTKKMALNAFKERKKRHIRILRHELKLIIAALELSEKKLTTDDFEPEIISHYEIHNISI